ncbi:hypothetical protein FPQ18DRAFT_415825 [Pyronema domesticum]|nr:hypothetical protein FPQ18DRAFT_415825 [Pyronema domesticum]
MDIYLTGELLAPAQHVEPLGVGHEAVISTRKDKLEPSGAVEVAGLGLSYCSFDCQPASDSRNLLRNHFLYLSLSGFEMEHSTNPEAYGTESASPPRSIPIDPLLLAWVPDESVLSAPAPTTSPNSSFASPAAVIPSGLQSTLPDSSYQQISSLAPAHGLPVVSAAQEQSILTSLSLPSALQLDMAISPFAYLAAMPTASEVVQICDVPESLYGRVKLEMYPTQVQRRAVMRMWRAFAWKFDKEMDVKKFVSRELAKRFHQSKRSADKKQAKLAATRNVANAAGLPAAALLDGQTTLTTVTNLHPDAALAGASSGSSGSPGYSCSSGSSGSPPAGASSNTDSAWSDPDFSIARAYLGDTLWYTVDYTIATSTSGAFNNWGDVPAVGVLLQDWMFNIGFLDAEDVLLEEMDDHDD